MNADVAVVGLGRMGSAIAERLLAAGHRVAVWNRTPGKAGDLVAAGAVEAAELADIAGTPVMLSTVLDDSALDALSGNDSLFARPGTRVWIDCSTVSVAAAERAQAAAAGAGVAFASAPVSGNPGVVRAGNATFALSSDDDAAILEAQAVLGDVARAVHVVGRGVTATLVKQCTNALLGIVMEALAEIAVLGEKGGVSRSALMGFINDSAVGSPFSKYKTESIVELNMTPTFTAAGLRKDMRLALGSARLYEASAPLVSAAEVEYSRLVSSGLGDDRDFAALILQVARDSALDIRPERAQGA